MAAVGAGAALAIAIGIGLHATSAPRSTDVAPRRAPASELAADADVNVMERPGPVPRTETVAAASSAHLTHERLEAALPLMKGATPLVRIGDQLEANHVPMVLASYEIAARAEAVIDFYADYFAAKGWPYDGTAKPVEQTGFATISATLEDAELQLVVMATPQAADKGTTVILGLADLGAWERHDDQQLAIGFPTYPGTRPSVIATTDEGVRAEIVTFTTPDDPSEVRSFLEATLGRAGFRRAEGEEDAATWIFVGPAQQWHVQAIASDGQTSVLARSVPAR